MFPLQVGRSKFGDHHHIATSLATRNATSLANCHKLADERNDEADAQTVGLSPSTSTTTGSDASAGVGGVDAGVVDDPGMVVALSDVHEVRRRRR